jgi:fucose permease
MHLCFLFSGMATLLLESALPAFSRRWHLADSGSGLLLASQFFGLFLGSISLSRHLRRSLLLGCLAATAGFLLLAATVSFSRLAPFATASLLVLGFGLGQVTASVNVLSALRFEAPQQRSAALSLLNFTWSAGAVASPVFAAVYLANFGLIALLATFASLGALLFVAVRTFVPDARKVLRPAEDLAAKPQLSAMALRPFFYVCLMLFFYGGLEATLGGWLSTYTIRYTTLSVADAALATTSMWAAFATGRALAAAVLRVVPERLVRLGGILITTVATLGLRAAHTGPAIAVCGAFIGLGIAPFFPITFSILISRGPSPRQAGIASANIGLGSAIWPYLTGLISTGLGSLQTALFTPIFIALVLLGMSWFQSKPAATHVPEAL